MPITDSPLRYPGGKSQLYPTIKKIIKNTIPGNCTYVEPFAGGAGLALKLLFRGDVSSLILNDLDNAIFCFWDTCLHYSEELCRMIISCEPSIDEWETQRSVFLNPSEHSNIEYAFATLFLNRCNVSGVILGGPIGGKTQAGNYKINARYNPDELVRKIRKIHAYASKILFYHMDALDFIANIVTELPITSSFINIDPPYVKKGPYLYRNSFTHEDHKELSQLILKLKQHWIVTYDECNLIRELYSKASIQQIQLSYSAGLSKRGNELMISNLGFSHAEV